MKKLNVVRGVAFLTMLLASADVAEPQKMAHRPPFGRHAKCERCGGPGPTVPVAPVVFRVRPAVGSGFRKGLRTPVWVRRSELSCRIRPFPCGMNSSWSGRDRLWGRR